VFSRLPFHTGMMDWILFVQHFSSIPISIFDGWCQTNGFLASAPLDLIHRNHVMNHLKKNCPGYGGMDGIQSTFVSDESIMSSKPPATCTNATPYTQRPIGINIFWSSSSLLEVRGRGEC
jgi:hypothetical protein